MVTMTVPNGGNPIGNEEVDRNALVRDLKTERSDTCWTSSITGKKQEESDYDISDSSEEGD